METNELPSIDDKLVDTSTIHTTNSIYSLLNINSRFAGSTARRRPTLLPQGASRNNMHTAQRSFCRFAPVSRLPISPTFFVYFDAAHSCGLTQNFLCYLHTSQPHLHRRCRDLAAKKQRAYRPITRSPCTSFR